MKMIKKVGIIGLCTLSLCMSFMLGVKFTLDNQKIVTLGDHDAKSAILCYQKDYYVNPDHINWGAIID